MARKKQTSRKTNIVILCEGTDTEFNYFNNAKEYVMRQYPGRFSSIKVVPVSSEVIKHKNLKNRKARPLQPVSGYHYYCQWENSKEEYDAYKAMPTRFVRETQLFMEREGYVEGWAVFDKDIHPDHEKAFDLARSVSNLHIAFSSYCFEEWLLAHFERNEQAFSHSECMATKYDSKECGTGVSPDDCHGTVCLAGLLREKKYIPSYSKLKTADIFEQYTLNRIDQVCANAAWLRSLSSTGKIYERNPYTDVDRLVMRLLDKQESYEWYSVGESFAYGGTQLAIDKKGNSLSISNQGDKTCVIHSDSFMFISEDGESGHPVNYPAKVVSADSSSGEIAIPLSYSLLRIIDGRRVIFVPID